MILAYVCIRQLQDNICPFLEHPYLTLYALSVEVAVCIFQGVAYDVQATDRWLSVLLCSLIVYASL